MRERERKKELEVEVDILGWWYLAFDNNLFQLIQLVLVL